MPKIKKLKRKKKFRANVNRKRLRNKLRKLPEIECKQIKQAWESKISTAKNLEEMGLAYDPNRVLKIPNVKSEMLKFVKNDIEEAASDSEDVEKKIPAKAHVVESLENDAKHPRAKLFRLPNNEVHFVTYMMDKYADDYEAMVRDRKNYYQLTWKQLRSKIERFKRIPEQYAEYLVKKGEIILEDPTPLKKIKPDVLQEPVEKKTNTKLSRRKRKNAKSLVETVWQEESIFEDDSINININNTNTTVDIERDESSHDQNNDAKKLQLFSDDENDNVDSNVSDSEDDTDANEKSKFGKNKALLNLEKSKSKQKNKKFRVR